MTNKKLSRQQTHRTELMGTGHDRIQTGPTHNAEPKNRQTKGEYKDKLLKPNTSHLGRDQVQMDVSEDRVLRNTWNNKNTDKMLQKHRYHHSPNCKKKKNLDLKSKICVSESVFCLKYSRIFRFCFYETVGLQRWVTTYIYFAWVNFRKNNL